VNAVMDPRVPPNLGNYLAAQGGLRCMEWT